MIRDYHQTDLPPVMALWLDETINAHPFIGRDYWHQVASLVEQQYLPNAKTWVYEYQSQIVGFISILNNQLIGALFVKQTHQRMGIGKALMEFVKLHYPLLLLEVYPQNKQACQFYQAMGFTTISESFNQETNAVMATMCYQSPAASQILGKAFA